MVPELMKKLDILGDNAVSVCRSPDSCMPLVPPSPETPESSTSRGPASAGSRSHTGEEPSGPLQSPHGASAWYPRPVLALWAPSVLGCLRGFPSVPSLPGAPMSLALDRS